MGQMVRYCFSCGRLLEARQQSFCGDMCREVHAQVFSSHTTDASSTLRDWDDDGDDDADDDLDGEFSDAAALRAHAENADSDDDWDDDFPDDEDEDDDDLWDDEPTEGSGISPLSGQSQLSPPTNVLSFSVPGSDHVAGEGGTSEPSRRFDDDEYEEDDVEDEYGNEESEDNEADLLDDDVEELSWAEERDVDEDLARDKDLAFRREVFPNAPVWIPVQPHEKHVGIRVRAVDLNTPIEPTAPYHVQLFVRLDRRMCSPRVSGNLQLTARAGRGFTVALASIRIPSYADFPFERTVMLEFRLSQKPDGFYIYPELA
jgi:hypothetical protein